MTLADMKPGQKGRINTIDTSHTAVVRLMVLGLVEGVTVQVENIAIGGDPIEISVFGSSISLRKQDAGRFGVILEQASS
ncbi:MAG TPA: FeoA domain-containing protein [Xanthomonadales bacterium]|nr:FeoA domain-containing protein [Xanthomonadales bacterium]